MMARPSPRPRHPRRPAARPPRARRRGDLFEMTDSASQQTQSSSGSSSMDDYQKFEFDLHGVIVVKGVLDPATVAELRSILCVFSHSVPPPACWRLTTARPGRAGWGAGMRRWRRGRTPTRRGTTRGACAATRRAWAPPCSTGESPVRAQPPHPTHGRCGRRLLSADHLRRPCSCCRRADRELLDNPTISPMLEDLIGDPGTLLLLLLPPPAAHRVSGEGGLKVALGVRQGWRGTACPPSASTTSVRPLSPLLLPDCDPDPSRTPTPQTRSAG